MTNLKKIKRNIQCSLFSAEFYGEFYFFKVMSKILDVGILRKVNFFTDSVLSVGVLKLAITTINCVEYLHEAGRKTNICIGKYFCHIVTSTLQL